MGYSLSMDASVKIKMGDVNGLLNHNARDIDKENGIEIAHSNPDIDSARTEENETYYYDYEDEGFNLCTDKKQITDALQKRLSDVKKPLRKDAVVLRPLLLQLDPEYYKEHPDEDINESMDAMLEWAYITFGEHNLISTSIHNDETNPHMHVLFCPVTDDGRLSQKDWFTNPTALKQMHQDFRQYMTDKGYDIDMQNRKPNKYANRLSVEEYKELARMQDDKKAFEAEKRAFAKEKKAVSEKEKRLNAREVRISERETHLEARIGNFDSWWDKVTQTAEKNAKNASEAIERANKCLDDVHNVVETLVAPYDKSGRKLPDGLERICRNERIIRKNVATAQQINSRIIHKPLGFEDWEEEQKKKTDGLER